MAHWVMVSHESEALGCAPVTARLEIWHPLELVVDVIIGTPSRPATCGPSARELTNLPAAMLLSLTEPDIVTFRPR
jgi:hypothetical protein